ncbi:hypothetical protein O3M35_003922 [Rhynocoris fuscipes]|uniref:Uncharacterized protein n=1 Tax=Rhynocoris fuscipes TaxID=488301 RepID=A0AAW1CI29_9HEMI
MSKYFYLLTKLELNNLAAIKSLQKLLIINIILIIKLVNSSEFPDRECCDPVYPLAAVSASIGPDTPTPPQHTTRQGK